jgi:hypothetical protein
VVGQRPFFRPPRPARGRRGDARKAVGIARIYADLIRAGYGRTPADIGRLTWRQIQLFWRQEQAHERRLNQQRIRDNNAAFAGGRHAEKLLRELQEIEREHPDP